MDDKRQRHELTDFQKGEIVALAPYFSHTEIANQLDIPRTTVISFLESVRNTVLMDGFVSEYVIDGWIHLTSCFICFID